MNILEESEQSNASHQDSADKDPHKNGIYSNSASQPTVNNNTITSQQQPLSHLQQQQQRVVESTSPLQQGANMNGQSQVNAPPWDSSSYSSCKSWSCLSVIYSLVPILHTTKQNLPALTSTQCFGNTCYGHSVITLCRGYSISGRWYFEDSTVSSSWIAVTLVLFLVVFSYF